MIQTQRLTRTLTSSHSLTPSQLLKGIAATYQPPSYHSKPRHGSFRTFHTTPSTKIKEFFPEPDSPSIRTTRPAWSHPIYTEEQMNSIAVAHRDAKTWSDRSALAAVRLLRWGLDLATGYKHDPHSPADKAGGQGTKKPFAMTERKYLIRYVTTLLSRHSTC